MRRTSGTSGMVGRCARVLLAIVVLTASAWAAPAVGVTGYLDAFAQAVTTRRADAEELGTKQGRRDAKAFGKIEKKLAGKRVADGVAFEIKAAKAGAVVLEKQLSGESALLELLDAAADGYQQDIEAARDAFAQENGLGTGKTPPPAKLLQKANAALAKAGAAQVRSKRLAALAKAAKLLPNVTPGGGGGGGGPVPTGRGFPAAVAVDSSSRYLYVAERGGLEPGDVGGVRQMSFDAAGHLTDLSPARVAAGATPWDIAAHPSKGFVYVANFADKSISQFAIGPGGRLVPLSPASVPVESGAGPQFVEVTPEGDVLVITSNSVSPSGTVVATHQIAADGTLGPQVGAAFGPPDPAGLAVTPYLDDEFARWALVPTRFRSGTAALDPGVRKFGISLGGTVDPPLRANADVLAAELNVQGDQLHVASPVFEQGLKHGVVTFNVQPGMPGILQIGQPLVLGTPSTLGRAYIARAGNTPWIYYGDPEAGVIHSLVAQSDLSVTLRTSATVPAPGIYALECNQAGTLLFAVNAGGSGAATNLVTVYQVGSDGSLTAP